ncbi:PIN-like domain-containing protein [Streptococcus uberis]|nr:PIN-like domain-containing protein [Streptococcus uberis]
MDWNEINNLYNTDDDEMYDNAILIFDTSSLLELYFYSTESAIEILEKCILHFQDRLFLPNHVKFEFDKNREVIIEKQTLGYQNVFNKKK